MPFLVISFQVHDAITRTALLAYLYGLGGKRLDANRFVIQTDEPGAAVSRRLQRFIKDGHLWVMQTWQRPEVSYLSTQPQLAHAV